MLVLFFFIDYLKLIQSFNCFLAFFFISHHANKKINYKLCFSYTLHGVGNAWMLYLELNIQILRDEQAGKFIRGNKVET